MLTLDAGGTNFVFSAIQGGKAITEPVRMLSNAHDLDLCLNTMKNGFNKIIKQVTQKPHAISFAFPGPADYPNGVIGDLGNLPAFRGGVPLKAILELEFNIPVYINNDGDLYAYGEALGGILPEINQLLKEKGSKKRYKNLVGITLGTGFGAGIVRNEDLLIGDNSIASEVWLMSNRFSDSVNSEELVSTRSVQNGYTQITKTNADSELMPKDIYDIAIGHKPGDKDVALMSFAETGKALGDSIANLCTLIDGIVVIGGGITGAKDLYMPSVMAQLKGHYTLANGEMLPRLVQRVFNFDEEEDRAAFCADYSQELPVPGTNQTVTYDPIARLAIATSHIGASEAIALGAYAFALKQMLKTSNYITNEKT